MNLSCSRTHLRITVLLALLLGRNVAAQQDGNGSNGGLLWSSTGGGWRAMFADVGFANLFRQAGLMDEESTRFDAVATVSGSSWFSTQLFYSQEFYNRVVFAKTPEELESFVLQWMKTYSDLSSDISNETKVECDTSGLESEEGEEHYTTETGPADILKEICELLVEYEHDWALFIQAMLNVSSTDYGDTGFVDTIASSENKIAPLKDTDLLIQAALMPNSRLRHDNTASSAVYLGYDNSTQQQDLFTVALSAAWVVGDSSSGFWYGTDDILPASELQTYVAPTPTSHSWEVWEPFFLYPGINGTVSINGNQVLPNNSSGSSSSSPGKNDNGEQEGGPFRVPFGGPDSTTVVQVAAISSAAAGGGSPLIPSAFTQSFSLGYYTINEAKVAWYWRVVIGVLSGLAAAAVFGYLGYWCANCCKRKKSNENVNDNGDVEFPSNIETAGDASDDYGDSESGETTQYLPLTAGIVSGICCGFIIGTIVGLYVGFGSILVPTVYDLGVGRVYENPEYDKFAVCSQWPNPCGTQDAQMIDGYFIDNPAVVINVGNYLQKNGVDSNQTMKLIITNTNQFWDNDFTIGQILHYFSSYFNQDVEPGGFLWSPGLTAPYRSPQIFEEYLDKDGLNNALVPIPGSNMTTATFSVTTVDNPSFGVSAGQPVDILLINLNADITTYVVGKTVVDELTQPLADMTNHIAFDTDLLDRVQTFIAEGVVDGTPVQ